MSTTRDHRRKRGFQHQDGTFNRAPTGNAAEGTTTPRSGTVLLHLPDEVLAKILSQLPDINSVLSGPARVCRRLNRISNHPTVWKHITIRRTNDYSVRRRIPLSSTVTCVEDYTSSRYHISCGRYYSSLKPLFVSLRELTIKAVGIVDISLYDLPKYIQHLHLDCEVPEYFFEPLQDGATRASCAQLSCLRVQLLPRQASTVLHLGNFDPPLSSLAVTCSGALLPNLVTVLGTIGQNIEHLCLDLSGCLPGSNVAEKSADMILASCPKLQSLCIKFDKGRITFEFIYNLAKIVSGSETLRKSLKHLSLGASTVDADASGLSLKLFTNLETLDIWTDAADDGKFASRCRFLLPKTELRMHHGKPVPFAVYPEMIIKHL